jgi:hypothetical protein
MVSGVSVQHRNLRYFNLINTDTRLRSRSRFGAAKARNLIPETYRLVTPDTLTTVYK